MEIVMAFSDPQSVTIGGVTTSLPRVSSGNGTGAFASGDGSILMEVRNSYGKRIRRTVRLTTKKLVSDPLLPSSNIPVSGAVYLVVDVPVQGITAAEIKDQAVGLLTNLTASTNANLIKALGGEA